MIKLFQMVFAEIQAVSATQESSVEPTHTGCVHEHSVGTLDPHLKKLFFVFGQYARRANELKVELTRCQESERSVMSVEFHRFYNQANTLGQLFWTSCRVQFPELWGKGSIAIRKGWNLVWCEHPFLPEPDEMIDTLLRSVIIEEILGFELSEQVPDKATVH